MRIRLRQKIVISPPDKTVFPCLTKILGKVLIAIITAFGGFHKDKVYAKFRFFIMEKLIPVYNTLIVGNINAMHFVIARHTYSIAFQPVTGFPTISVRTDKEPIKSGGKYCNNTKSQQIAYPYRHGTRYRLFLFPGRSDAARSRLTTRGRFVASHSIGFSRHMRVV